MAQSVSFAIRSTSEDFDFDLNRSCQVGVTITRAPLTADSCLEQINCFVNFLRGQGFGEELIADQLDAVTDVLYGFEDVV